MRSERFAPCTGRLWSVPPGAAPGASRGAMSIFEEKKTQAPAWAAGGRV